VTRIANKAQFYALHHAGLLGNRPQSWETIEELRASGYRGPVTIRHRNINTRLCAYGIRHDALEPYILSSGKPANEFNYHAPPPDDRLTIQGELMRSARSWELIYSRWKLPMRVAFAKNVEYASGVGALAIIKQYMCPNSYGDVQDIFDQYDGCAIEFTCFECSTGHLPNRNTLIWEVRHY